MGWDLAKLITEAVKGIVDLILRAIDGDDDAYRRLEDILSSPAKTTLARLRAERIRQQKFGDQE